MTFELECGGHKSIINAELLVFQNEATNLFKALQGDTL